MSKRPGFIPDIEILRALAVLGVIVQHLNGNLFPRFGAEHPAGILMSGGWVGVDLFFAISGFVIARSFLPRVARGENSPPRHRLVFQFWIARLFRLAPSAWLWLLVILFLSAFYNDSGVFADVKTNLAWTAAGIFNYSNYLFVQYFGVARPGVSFVYWSLSLEEQFYIVFPVLAVILRRHVVWLVIALVAFQLFEPRGLYGMMFRTDAIGLGVLLAIAHQQDWFARFVPQQSSVVLRLSTLGAVVLVFYLGTSNQTELPQQIGLVAVASALTVWLCSGRGNALAGNGILSGALIWIGRHSFAMYLIHIPVMFFIRETCFRLGLEPGDAKVSTSLLALALILALAAANGRWLETPLRLRGKVIAEKLNPSAGESHPA